jgi:hypothetical protein
MGITKELRSKQMKKNTRVTTNYVVTEPEE